MFKLSCYLKILTITMLTHNFSSSYSSDNILAEIDTNPLSSRSNSTAHQARQQQVTSWEDIAVELIYEILGPTNTIDQELYLVCKNWFKWSTGYTFNRRNKKGFKHI